MNEKIVNVRVPGNEFEILERYAAQTRRTKTEIVREFIRSLEQKLEQPTPRRTKPKRPPPKSKG